MTYTWIRMGEPRLKGKVRGPSVVPPVPNPCDISFDSSVDPRFGFEVDEDLRDSRDMWGANIAWGFGWRLLTDVSSGGNGTFRESHAGGSIGPEFDPAEGDYFYYGETTGDNIQGGHYAFWDYGNLPINDIDGWKYPGTGEINEGDILHVRLALALGGTDAAYFEVTWFDSDDNPLDDPVFAGTDFENPVGEWFNFIAGQAPGLPGLPTQTVATPFIAPPDVAYYSLVVFAGTAIQGGNSYAAVDSLRICRQLAP